MNIAYRGRTRTGCLACRASKVKCDEQPLTCRRCVRQKKECLYPKRRTLHTVPRLAKSVAASQASETFNDYGISPLKSVQQDDTLSPAHTPSSQSVRTNPLSSSGQSPSLLSTLISQDIFICTTIDLLAANHGRPTFSEFEQQVQHPFITPYDPANWTSFKQHAVGMATHSNVVATAILAAQTCFQARRLALPHTTALASYTMAWETLVSAISSLDDDQNFDTFLTSVFLLCMVEILVPGEVRPRLLDLSPGPLDTQLRYWSRKKSPQSALSLRLASWMLISHAAARRSGNSGLLSTDVRTVLEEACGQAFPLAPVPACRGDMSSDAPILVTLTEPFFTFYSQLQTLSTRVADLSHYHRDRFTGEDQTEVSSLMAELKSQIELLWESRLTLLHQQPDELCAKLSSPTIATPLVLLATLCTLTYHTELVELGRNLSAEQAPTPEAIVHLAHMRNILESNCATVLHPSFLRSLFLYAIESSSEADSLWAISRIQDIKDPISYSEFFANFAQGLANEQRQKQRRVTTKWWCRKAFEIDPPYL